MIRLYTVTISGRRQNWPQMIFLPKWEAKGMADDGVHLEPAPVVEATLAVSLALCAASAIAAVLR